MRSVPGGWSSRVTATWCHAPSSIRRVLVTVAPAVPLATPKLTRPSVRATPKRGLSPGLPESRSMTTLPVRQPSRPALRTPVFSPAGALIQNSMVNAPPKLKNEVLPP